MRYSTKVVSSAELVGSFVDPAVFCKLALPHLKSAAGSSATGCSSCLLILAALIRGCNPKLLKPLLKVSSYNPLTSQTFSGLRHVFLLYE